MRRRRLTILPAAGLALLAGCTSGDLTIDLLVTAEMRSFDYRLEPDGRLTVAEGGGLVEGQRDRPVHEARLDPATVEQFKQVIVNSGFLLQDSPIETGLSSGPAVRLEVKLGLWHNVMQTRGLRPDSVRKIADEMNRHLPARYQLQHEPHPDERIDKDFQRLFE